MSITIDRLNPAPQDLSEERADSLVELLNTTEDACGWSYERVESKTPGNYNVQITDEDGYVLGRL